MTNEQSGQLDLVATGTSGPALPAKTTSGKMAMLFNDTRRQPNITRMLTTFFPSHLCPSSSPTRPDVTSPLEEILRGLTEPVSPPCSQQYTPPPYDNSDNFQLNWDVIDHDQLYLPSALDERLTMMTNTLATWLANGDDLIALDEDESDSPQEIPEDDFSPGTSTQWVALALS
ncbi:hypothetical protein EDC04DRAFT_2898847 [Pisolithus marmoratus]|nr:hypothetical protein EDC04DRAFT_2898847 [Pisolithus marmoratus]